MKDVIVIGAGPSGSFAAYRLAKAGFTVDILEEHREVGKPVECTGLVSQRVLKYVRTKSIAGTVRGANIFFPNGKSVHIEKDDPTIVLFRDAFDKDVAAMAIGAGSGIRINARALSVTEHDDHVTVRYRENGSIKEEDARIVIGADGINSVVRRDVYGMRQKHVVSTLQYDMASGIEDEDSVNVYLGSQYTHGFFGWAVPGGDIVRVGTGSYKASARPYMDNLSRRFGDNRTLGITGAGIPIRMAERLSSRRTVLVGDAGGIVKPLSGGGIYTGIFSSDVAANYVVEALESDSSEASLRKYDREIRNTIGKELKKDAMIQRIYSRISDRSFNRIYSMISNEKIIDVINRSGDIDYPSTVIIKVLLRNPGILYSMWK
ncbi:geranylgeranyl reductase related protein [Thermoplasma acidophilum]|uniref:Geranylgeranyl reductase related protein n=1 Tax=Thermoplasma acidophilum (strain ATCC 25905 / DSM 1728 / JCM 9062 / NBRC 15155 / AMRC-C165) TaxID=273075 RepID=Q9HI52_THEAC|nr:geranylgeranyl reductase family protein [Thermoplasma acidophilum]MCY0851990.1 geranylgeranyl reductase family protein [Thermoplasma acidophilum]CAC12613.1 geranylgeranyl reductase related protein [Thermoplasma acidophilum]